jgi:hypothetical protein
MPAVKKPFLKPVFLDRVKPAIEPAAPEPKPDEKTGKPRKSKAKKPAAEPAIPTPKLDRREYHPQVARASDRDSALVAKRYPVMRKVRY